MRINKLQKIYIAGIIMLISICLYKKQEIERDLKICGIYRFSNPKWSINDNKLNNINYRVKWAMGSWYNTSQIVTLPNKYYFSNKYSTCYYPLINYFSNNISTCYYPLLKNIMRNTSQFLYAHGDVQHSTSFPCFCKTRPIDDKTNIILLLNFKRHWKDVFNLPKIDKPFDKKKSIVIWRGGTTGNEKRSGNRFSLIEKWYDVSDFIDVGFSQTSKKKESFKKYVKSYKYINKLLQYKYLISAEGNDVSSGLKWMLYSQSVVIMPKPTIVSWFMEDHLVPFKHYVPIKNDWSDLLKMYNWCENNQNKCKDIINNANNYVRRFIDEIDNGFAGMIHNEITRIYRKNISFKTKGK